MGSDNLTTDTHLRYWVVAVCASFTVLIHIYVDLINQFETAFYFWLIILVLSVFFAIAQIWLKYKWKPKIFINSVIFICTIIILITLIFRSEDIEFPDDDNDFLIYFGIVLTTAIITFVISLVSIIGAYLLKVREPYSYGVPVIEDIRETIINLIKDETTITHRSLYNKCKALGINRQDIIEAIEELEIEKILKKTSKKSRTYHVDI